MIKILAVSPNGYFFLGGIVKILVILFLFISGYIFPQLRTISGRVVDAETNLSLIYANLVLASDNTIGATTDSRGRFTLTLNKSNSISLIVSYIGYYSVVFPIDDNQDELLIKLQPKILPSQSVLIKGSIGRKGESPFVYDKISSRELKKNYVVQDIPEYLGALPSTTFYSESGNGIGYNYISIRGFDQRRITVAINGIPQNDPEDHNVYWLDFPDLLANTELIQVQRGSGAGLFGYPAIGGAINIITSSYTRNPKADFSASLGSYDTRKYSVSFSSGLVMDKYSFSGKLSRILSSGYREKSFVKFNSYYFAIARFDENITTQLNFYGGPIEDGLSYTGLPKFAVKDKNLRKANYSYWEAGANEFTYSVERRAYEIENFSQPHFEILNELQLSDKITFNSALFLITGQGFFDYDASWADTTYLRLTNEFGFQPTLNPRNALIRAQVENVQYGFIPRINFEHANGELIAGGEIRIHKSDHWGAINYGENLPAGLTKDYRYYFYNGGKEILNGFVNENYKIYEQFTVLGEVQIAYHKYKLKNEKHIGTDFSVSNVFLNPRLGLSYKLDNSKQLYFSLARVTREPRLKNYYDAAESSGGALPQFESTTDTAGNITSYDFTKPLVKPETMNDIEFGGVISDENYSISINLFLMLFENEIVKNGQLDRFGQPVTGNVERTNHRGIELSAWIGISDEIKLSGNVTYSLNTIEKGSDFINSSDYININGNRISGFPDYLANFSLIYDNEVVSIRLDTKYVGEFYSDNYDKNLKNYLNIYPGFVNYTDNKNEAYITQNLFASYSLGIWNSLSKSKIYLQINNLFDHLYSAYAIGKEFFPAAERNFIGGVQLSL